MVRIPISPHPKLRVWPLEQARTGGVPGLRACDSLYFSTQTEFGFERFLLLVLVRFVVHELEYTVQVQVCAFPC